MGPAEYYELSSNDGRPTGGEQPAALLEQLLRHAGVGYEIVQSLDVPVLQTVEQLPNVLQFFVTSVPAVAEQVFNVPKISQDRTRQSLVDHLRQPQTAEQLVEVPTIIPYSSLHGLVEQNVGIPVPPGRGRVGGGRLLGSQQRLPSKIVDIPVPPDGQDLPSAASSSGLPGTANQWVFLHFSPWEKVRSWVRTRGGTAPRVEPIHAASLCRAHGSRGG